MAAGAVETWLSALTAELEPAEPRDEFSARYSAGSGMLLLESGHPHDWPIGATIDGLLTLDLTSERVLASVELAWPRERWRESQAVLPLRSPATHRIRMPKLSSAGVDGAPEVTAVLLGRSLVVQLEAVPATRRVPLGPSVDALIAGESLVGFVANQQAFSILP
jgi:hypothetical protein